jgi:hypothetical protein
MSTAAGQNAQARKPRSRLTIDLRSDIKRRLRLIAAYRDISMRQYVLETLEAQMARDWADLAEREELLALTTQSDPVLAELWDNDKDAAYNTMASSAPSSKQ